MPRNKGFKRTSGMKNLAALLNAGSRSTAPKKRKVVQHISFSQPAALSSESRRKKSAKDEKLERGFPSPKKKKNSSSYSTAAAEAAGASAAAAAAARKKESDHLSFESHVSYNISSVCDARVKTSYCGTMVCSSAKAQAKHSRKAKQQTLVTELNIAEAVSISQLKKERVYNVTPVPISVQLLIIVDCDEDVLNDGQAFNWNQQQRLEREKSSAAAAVSESPSKFSAEPVTCSSSSASENDRKQWYRERMAESISRTIMKHGDLNHVNFSHLVEDQLYESRGGNNSLSSRRSSKHHAIPNAYNGYYPSSSPIRSSSFSSSSCSPSSSSPSSYCSSFSGGQGGGGGGRSREIACATKVIKYAKSIFTKELSKHHAKALLTFTKLDKLCTTLLGQKERLKHQGNADMLRTVICQIDQVESTKMQAIDTLKINKDAVASALNILSAKCSHLPSFCTLTAVLCDATNRVMATAHVGNTPASVYVIPNQVHARKSSGNGGAGADSQDAPPKPAIRKTFEWTMLDHTLYDPGERLRLTCSNFPYVQSGIRLRERYWTGSLEARTHLTRAMGFQQGKCAGIVSTPFVSVHKIPKESVAVAVVATNGTFANEQLVSSKVMQSPHSHLPMVEEADRGGLEIKADFEDPMERVKLGEPYDLALTEIAEKMWTSYCKKQFSGNLGGGQGHSAGNKHEADLFAADHFKSYAFGLVVCDPM